MSITPGQKDTIKILLTEYGFKKRENIETDKHWYSFAGKFAKLIDAEVEALEFDLYSLSGEHLKLTPINKYLSAFAPATQKVI